MSESISLPLAKAGASFSAQRLKEGLTLVCFFLLVAVWVSYARLNNPTFGAQGDLPAHYQLTRAYAQSLAEGAWLPRWAGILDGGRGDAFFTFYPPLFYGLTALAAKLLQTDFINALKVSTLVCLLLAQINAYLLARNFFPKTASVLAAALYVLLPAYALLTLHRAFLPNGLALAFVPLALLATHRLLLGEQVKHATALFAFSLSLIVLTHVITTFLCAIAVGLLALCYLPEAGWRGWKNLLLAGLLALALTVFFLLPQQLEMSWVQVKLQTAQQDFRNYFLFAAAPDSQQFHQAWAELNRAASWITVLQTALIAIIGLAFWRKSQPQPQRLLLRFCLALAAFGLLISLPVSLLLWERLPGLAYIQFPWRLQPIVGLCGGLLLAAFLACRTEFSANSRKLLTGALALLLLGNFLFTYVIAKHTKAEIARAELIKHLENPARPPITIEQLRELEYQEEFTYLAALANQIYFRPLSADALLYAASKEYGGLSFVNGRGQIVAQQLTNQHREFRLDNTEPVRVRLNTYAYPHWAARLDGNAVTLNTETGSGLLLLDLPAGQHTLTLAYEIRQPAQVWARRISAVAWLLFVVWVLWLVTLRLKSGAGRVLYSPSA
ncbi:MAG: hypothetical protein HY011_08430 [Acidobacteria bacterium]|nr:hypothetical protein [Acidobacteriota bacterium]